VRVRIVVSDCPFGAAVSRSGGATVLAMDFRLPVRARLQLMDELLTDRELETWADTVDEDPEAAVMGDPLRAWRLAPLGRGDAAGHAYRP